MTLHTVRRPSEPSAPGRFGRLVATSTAMRATFALLERAARSHATVLLGGETGTGKGEAARAIHEASARRSRPFVTIDCSSIPASLLETELFGHERGAFTGAVTSRAGAFEEAEGGTVFLDEIGELPRDLQAKFLRVLENREIRRVGAGHARPIDVRVIAATHRDLKAEVAAGRFRSDLYFRLAVLEVTIPALRDRAEDLPALVDALIASLGADVDQAAHLRAPESLARMQRRAWPGNVRELRNHVERCLVFGDASEVAGGVVPCEQQPASARGAVPLGEARQRAVDAFERGYLADLMRAHEHRMTRAATAAGITRVHLYKLLRRHGMK